MAHDESHRAARSDAQRNLERVLRAAHELFAERGADMTMEEVARHAGVGVGTIYRRFSSKEELLAAVSHAACASTCDSLRAASHAAHPIARLKALALVQFHHSAYASLTHAPPPMHAAEPEEVARLLHALLADAIADGQRQHLLRDGDPRLLAAFCLELLSLRTCRRLGDACQADAETLAEEAVRFVLHGLSRVTA